MKSTVSVGIAVISSFLFVCHFCNFVSCKVTCDDGCTWDDIQNECICDSEVQSENPFLTMLQRATKKKKGCEHHTTICKSTGDPHFTTFKGNHYHIYKDKEGKTGVYTLVKFDSRSLWIQAHHVLCSSVSCNCGVMAREGNSIIGVTQCNQAYPLLVEYQLDKKAASGSIRTISGGWRITLVSGIEIEVVQYTWDNKRIMDVYVKGLKSEVDRGLYSGLCSIKMKDNSVCTDQTCEQYRVNDFDSFFSITQSNLPNCSTSNKIYPQCGCHGTYPKCADPEGDYLLRTDMTKVCRKNDKNTKNKNEGPNQTINKRDDDDEHDEETVEEDYIDAGDLNSDTKSTEVDERELNKGYRFFDNVRALDPRAELGVEDGKSRCSAALKLSPTYEICSGRVDTSDIVEKCALDVDLMDDYGPSKFAPTELETACLDNIRLSLESDTISDASLQELNDLLTRVEKLVCPSQCSQNGECVGSKCQCNEGYVGTDCSLTVGQVPVVDKVIMPVCNIRKHPCTQIHVEASDVADPEKVVCKMRSVNDLDGAVPAVQTSTPVISAGLVLCKLPQMPVSVKESENGKSTTVFLVQVSISNDGETYSKELPFTVVDGQCMECPASQNTPCRLKENTCSIGGRCYKAEDSCPLDEAKICKPAKCTTKWTSESSTNCDDGFENCT